MTLPLAGCTTEEISSWFNGNYFGIDENVRENGTQPHGNTQEFLLSTYDVKDVTDDTLDDLPEYDFSGPSNYTNRLNSENNMAGNTIDESTSFMTVYLVPESGSMRLGPYMPISEAKYNELEFAIATINQQRKDKVQKNKLETREISIDKMWDAFYTLQYEPKSFKPSVWKSENGNVSMSSSEKETFWKYAFSDVKMQLHTLDNSMNLTTLADMENCYFSCANDVGKFAEWEWKLCKKIKDSLNGVTGIIVKCDKNDRKRGWDNITQQIIKKQADVVVIIGSSYEEQTYFVHQGNSAKILASKACEYYEKLYPQIISKLQNPTILSSDSIPDHRMFALRSSKVTAAILNAKFHTNTSDRTMAGLAKVIADSIVEYSSTFISD